MRVNLSVAIVEMVDESANFTGRDGEKWSSNEQGVILGSFFYGCGLLLLHDRCLPRRRPCQQPGPLRDARRYQQRQPPPPLHHDFSVQT